jgi:hypothetical protein
MTPQGLETGLNRAVPSSPSSILGPYEVDIMFASHHFYAIAAARAPEQPVPEILVVVWS